MFGGTNLDKQFGSILFSADQGINARLVQTLARHKHLSTTQRYIDVNENAFLRLQIILNLSVQVKIHL